VLDIIGDYSAYGKVTLMLDDEEAGGLWSKLNGSDTDTVYAAYGSARASEKYRSLFNTMRVDSLVVVHGYNVVQLSREGRFALPGMPPLRSDPARGKTLFSSGYGMGLLLALGPWHCMGFGLAFAGAGMGVAGAGAEATGVGSGASDDLNTSKLMAYLQDWINIL